MFGDSGTGCKINITAQRAIRQSVNTDVNHDRTGLQHLWGHKFGATDCSNYQVSSCDVFSQVLRLGMANRDGRPGIDQQGGHGFTNNVGATNHNGIHANQIDARRFQHFDHTVGRARDKSRFALQQGPDIFRMESINVLFWRDRF